MKKLFQTSSLVSVLNVSDYTVALTWYSAWLGEPDETPMDGMAEWRIADNAWLQLDATGETVTPSAGLLGGGGQAALFLSRPPAAPPCWKQELLLAKSKIGKWY